MAGKCLKAEPDAINKQPSRPSQARACLREPGEAPALPQHPTAHPAQYTPISKQTWWKSCKLREGVGAEAACAKRFGI